VKIDSCSTNSLGAREHLAADRRILALGVLAHHVEIDVAGLAVGERARHARHQPYRPQVDVLVEFAAEQQQRPPQRDVVGHRRRPAHRAVVDRVVAADPRLPVVGHHRAVPGVVVAAGEVEMIELQVDAELAGRRLQHAHALGHHFLADPVAGDHGDPVPGHSVLQQRHGAAMIAQRRARGGLRRGLRQPGRATSVQKGWTAPPPPARPPRAALRPPAPDAWPAGPPPRCSRWPPPAA